METLHYTSPAHGGWGVVKMAMLVPESYQLFVCPFACGRHGAIAACIEGLKDRLSYVFVDQSDIIEGYDNLILHSVPEYLSVIAPKRPKVLFIFGSCLDDLIGTDRDAIINELSHEFKDIAFRFCTMNPISLDSLSPPPVTMQRNMYSLLESEGKKERAINIMGNLDATAASSDLKAFLAYGGYDVHHIAEKKTFEAFRAMGRSAFDLVIAPQGVYAAKELEERLGIPYAFLPIAYDRNTIEESYKTLSSLLGITGFDFAPYRENAEIAVKETLDEIGNYPIAIDQSGTMRPYATAKALLEYGFNVAMILSNKPLPSERKEAEWILENHPEVKIVDPLEPKRAKIRDLLPLSIAIGAEGAYVTGSKHPVDITWDAGNYGWNGVERLLSAIRQAYRREASLEELIRKYNLVI